MAHQSDQKVNLRSAEEGTKEKAEAQEVLHPDIDGGWAWVVVAGVFLYNMLMGGTVKSLGLFYMEFVHLFPDGPVKVGLIGLALGLTSMVMSPLGGVVGDVVPVRLMTIVGGLVLMTSIACTSLAPSLWVAILTFGCIPGCTLGFIDGPILASIGRYFRHRRTLASGIAWSGSSIGNLIAPPLLSWSIATYGIRGALLVVGALWLHLCVVGLLLRPLRKVKVVCHKDEGEPEVKVTDLGQRSEGSACDVYRANWDDAGSCQSWPQISVGVARSRQSALCHPRLMDSYQSSILNGNIDTNIGTNIGTNIDTNVSTNIDTYISTGINTNIDTNINTRIDANINTYTSLSINTNANTKRDRTEPTNTRQNGIVTGSYVGALGTPADDNRRQLIPSNNERNPESTTVTESTATQFKTPESQETYVDEFSSEQSCMLTTNDNNNTAVTVAAVDSVAPPDDMTYLQFVRNASMWVVLPVIGCGFFGYYAPFVAMPLMAEEQGVPKRRVAMVLALIGLVEVVSRMSLGVIVDRCRLRTSSILTFAYVTMGIVGQTVALLTGFWSLVFYACAHGLLGGVVHIVMATLIGHVVPLHRTGSAMGLVVMQLNLASWPVTFVAGVMKELTGSYRHMLQLSSGIYLMGAALHVFGPLCSGLLKRACARRRE